VLTFSITPSGIVVTAHLSWDAPVPAPPSYAIYKFVAGVATKIGTTVNTNYAASGVNTGDQLAVRGVATDGTESPDSLKVTIVKPISAPPNLRLGVVG
jgi:hypothetical protein